jgi:hypothetical protein
MTRCTRCPPACLLTCLTLLTLACLPVSPFSLPPACLRALVGGYAPTQRAGEDLQQHALVVAVHQDAHRLALCQLRRSQRAANLQAPQRAGRCGRCEAGGRM